MPVRGKRSIYPAPPKSPTGIFSTRGKQKMDPNTHCCKELNAYALGSSTRSKPKGSGGQALRHQKPKRIW